MIRAVASAFAALVVASLCLSGCGQKGPLKLPEPPKPAAIAP